MVIRWREREKNKTKMNQTDGTSLASAPKVDDNVKLSVLGCRLTY